MSDTSHTVLIQSTAQPQGQTEDHNIFQRRTNMTHTSLYHSLLSPSRVTPLLHNLIWNRFTKVQFVVHPTLRLTSRLTSKPTELWLICNDLFTFDSVFWFLWSFMYTSKERTYLFFINTSFQGCNYILNIGLDGCLV